MLSYREAIEFLQSLQVFGARFGLETTRRLAALAGNPHEHLRFIHVAGTNGKGSTCAMLESIYRHAGLRVGLFTSPHLVAFTERIQVNRTLIPEAEVARLVEEMQPWLAGFSQDDHPTFFEVVTGMALMWFAEKRCDLVIWETGLGGRLDATNIVTPLASVITNIGWDHQQWLGDTLDKIAAEKAGIINPGVPVITAAEPGRGLEVITEVAQRLGAPLIKVGRASRLPGECVGASGRNPNALEWASGTPDLSLAGEHQRRNAALALATVRALAGLIPVGDRDIAAGLTSVQWPGRFQVVKTADGRTLVLDGAHNADGAAALRATFEERFAGARPALLLGVLADKDWPAILRELAPLASRIVLAPVSSERTLDPSVMLAACAEVCPAIPATVCSTVGEALQILASAPLVLVAGSLYLIGEAMEHLGLSSAPRSGERVLNEWKGSPK